MKMLQDPVQFIQLTIGNRYQELEKNARPLFTQNSDIFIISKIIVPLKYGTRDTWMSPRMFQRCVKLALVCTWMRTPDA